MPRLQLSKAGLAHRATPGDAAEKCKTCSTNWISPTSSPASEHAASCVHAFADSPSAKPAAKLLPDLNLNRPNPMPTPIPSLKPEELALLSQISRCGAGDFCHVQELNYNSQEDIHLLVILGVVEGKSRSFKLPITDRWFRVTALGIQALEAAAPAEAGTPN